MGLANRQGLILVVDLESPPIVCCKLLVIVSILQGVAACPLDLGRPVASNLLFLNATVVVLSFQCGSDVLRVLLFLMTACRSSRV